MLEDTVCIVAGAGRGIGKETAKLMADEGASVVVNDLGADLSGEGQDVQPAQQTVDEIVEAGGEAMAHYGDITDLEYTDELIQDTVDEYGAVHSITNFAGILRDRMIFNMSEEEWDAVIDVHLKGHFSLLRNASQQWKSRYEEEEFDRQRSFLGVSSSAAIGWAGQPNYAAAKAGVLGLVRNCAQELERYNVRVNALWPEAYTRMYKSIPEEYQPDGMTDETHGPQLVAPLPAFLASDEATDITGCTVGLGSGELSFISDPDRKRKIIKEVPADTKTGGWTPEQIADAWENLTDGYETTRTSKPSIPNVQN
ncbi:SDR family oxidoreductase [Halobellus clavatus]|jgi:NAD(P)-dependent dehydrogenase (short-subunit alcohol dehydrogenase family)|uniref:NAD(P)-dependent dehydrogenase, short-chain alcohol dehydrogenase family n=1 Tax=Halobellus clavatus TaxID=660517 RepID=A0A1H3ICF6_9EURY|nr:SDR family oxidoreductase [Halobellus clavatus]SDY25436.1 NAD(P)-dependent dehydrogenase, short-chain alcohol dehydrogenase family [Halobellus clavatus]